MDIIALSRLVVIHIRVRALPLLPTISGCTVFYKVEKLQFLVSNFRDKLVLVLLQIMFFRESDPCDGSDCKGEAYLARTLPGLQTNRYLLYGCW